MKHKFRGDRLLKLAKHLRKLKNTKKHQFNFATVYETNCKTVACALGECPTVFPRLWTLGKLEPMIKDHFTASPHLRVGARMTWSSASKFFGISKGWVDHLFQPTAQYADYTPSGQQLTEDATAKEVAENIELFVKHVRAGKINPKCSVARS